jgi:DNA-binding transcriptional regulator YdaS (Cro superfamily)
MFIFKDTLKRANHYAAYTSPEGVRYTRIPMELLDEIQEPQPPEEYLTNPEYWYRTEQDDTPYVVYTRKSDEQISAIQKALIPSSVTMRQGRLALLAAGKLNLVQASIDAIVDENLRQAAQIEWEYAQTIERNSQFVQQMAEGLDLSEEQLDELFTLGSTL